MYRVLIVDDEKAEREGLLSLLTQRDYPFEIVLHEDGLAALEYLRENPCDLLITDIIMPQMDGLSLCTEAQALHPGIVTIISSAYSDFKYTQTAIRIGVNDYLLKPVVIDAFYETIDRTLQLIENRSDKIPSPRISIEDSVDPIVAEIKSLIRSSYHQNISLETIAQQVYLSPGYLSSMFKKKTGRSIMQYITLCRMRRAFYLLNHTNMKITQISREVGYQDSSYFCFLFRKYFDVTPNQIRKGVSPDVIERLQARLE